MRSTAEKTTKRGGCCRIETMPKHNTASGMTAKQERFVAEYMVDGNATRAALAAGYSERTATRIGSELLTMPKVRKALDEARARIAAKLELTAEKVLADIARIALKAEAAGEFTAALKGNELLGKHLKLFTEKHEHGGIGGGPVQFAITEREAEL
jgi:phage terminase small subunit